ncbi:MAG: M28 family peptidase [Gammaproteobacteria bacterium]|nr:M28 family peptidase [Gammaproteobacteria bacterium]
MGKRNPLLCGLVLSCVGAWVMPTFSQAQTSAANWFGLPLPGPATDAEIVRTADDLPPLRSPFTGSVPEFEGERAHDWLTHIVSFSYEDRASGNPFWGRMSGSPAYTKAIDYIENELRSLGVQVARHEVPYYGPDRVPTGFHASAVLRDAAGNELAREPLQSAFPMRYRPLTSNGKLVLGSQQMNLTAEVVSIGQGSPADIATRDLRGRIALASVPSEPTPAYSDYRLIPERVAATGAAGLILAWNMPGNMQVALANCMEIPCINVGGRDGAFVRAVIARAANAGNLRLYADMGVETETRNDKTTTILEAKIPGRDSSQNIIVTAHADAYLTGANDNASGVAILLALVDYYRQHKPAYDIYFSVSPGHHSDTQGINPFLDRHPGLPAQNLLGINIEHVAQRGMVRSQYSVIDPNAKLNYDDASVMYVYSNADSDLREVQLSHADHPKVLELVKSAITRHRMNVPARVVKSTFQTEIGPVADQGGITLQPVEVSMVYHTSGDTAETVSPATLEAQALFYRDLIDEFSRHRKSDLLN